MKFQWFWEHLILIVMKKFKFKLPFKKKSKKKPNISWTISWQLCSQRVIIKINSTKINFFFKFAIAEIGPKFKKKC